MDDPNDPANADPRRLHNVFAPPAPGRVLSPVPSRAPSLQSAPINALSGARAGVASNGFRRVPAPSLRYLSAGPPGSAYDAPYNDPYSVYPYNRSYINQRGLADPYRPSYNSYGHPGRYHNPVILAAAENSQPVFDSIQAVIHSFNSISMLLESTFTATHMSFEALLGVAENFSRLRMFMVKLYSAVMTFKLARWFLTKLLYLMKMVRGHSGLSVEDDLWRSLSSETQRELFPPTNSGNSWPLVMFTGLLFATPYFVFKILNSVTPVQNPVRENIAMPLPTVNDDTPSRAQLHSEWQLILKSIMDWSSQHPKTLPIYKESFYWTSNNMVLTADSNGGWLYVLDRHGRKGYAPLTIFRPYNANSESPLPGMVTEIRTPTVLEPNSQLPITDEHNNPLDIPHLPECDGTLEENVK